MLVDWPMLASKRLFLAFVIAAAPACGGKVKRELVAPDSAAPQRIAETRTDYLKAHLRTGELVVYDEWQFANESVTGPGVHYSVDRETAKQGTHTVRFADVALFETNTQKVPLEVLGLAVITGISAALTVACLTNPKTCFGSCPTFYVDDEDGAKRLVAEGFSEAVAPSLEADDIDSLWRWRPTDRAVRVTMRNEALETHVVRRAQLLAVPRDAGDVVETTNGAFRLAGDWTRPVTCRAESGDCLPLIAGSDGKEWFSETNGKDLAARELVELQFEELQPGEKALVLRFRQTFLTTYLFYQALAYLGENATAMLAELERRNVERSAAGGGYEDIIGTIDVEVWNPDIEAWERAGQIAETGPIARNTLALELGHHVRGDTLGVRLNVARGNWRFDEISVVELGEPREPLAIAPNRVTGPRGDVTALLLDPAKALVTLPGDDYELEFELPEDPASYAYFLDTRGYYLEWMRDEWIAESNPAMAMMMLRFPETALKVLAPRYKEIEPQMEKMFWESRYEK